MTNAPADCSSNDFTCWSEYARQRIGLAIADNNPVTFVEEAFAIAYVYHLESFPHPSYYNTQFPIAVHFRETGDFDLQLFGFRMVVNGLIGYWQWESHNGGKFNIITALRSLGILREDEDYTRFDEGITHSGTGYRKVSKELLTRLVTYFHIPTYDESIGGCKSLTRQASVTHRRLLGQYCFDGVSSDYERYCQIVQNTF